MQKLPIILVTGFLGAGKTTFLQQIISAHKDRPIAYLINEFASVDVDSERLDLPQDKLLSVAGGSIFCRCKVTDFLKVMRGLISRIDSLDAVVIEASGIADPRVFAKMLDETGLNTHYSVSRIISIVDPGSFLKLLNTLPNIQYQLTSADTVLVNKADLFCGCESEKILRQVKQINPTAVIIKTIQAKADIDLFDSFSVPRDKSQGDYAKCKDPNFCTKTVKLDGAVTIDKLKRVVDANANNLYRVKGFVRIGSDVFDVDWTGDTWNVFPAGEVADTSLVIIADSQASIDTLISQM